MAEHALNPRTATKARIKRGSAAARRSMNRLDRDALADLEDTYRAAVRDMQRRIAAYGDSDGTLRVSTMREMLGQIEGRLAQLSEARNTLLDTNLDAAALVGVRPFAGEAAQIGAGLTQVAHDAVQFVRSFADADGVQLSDRLWRLDKNARELATRHIESAIVQGHSSSQAAQEFLARGQPVPANHQQAIANASAVRVARVFGTELMTGEGNPYAQARRLFRTEINRAHGEAYMAGAESHPDVVGFRYLLSPNHPRPDICDMHSSVNLYGLGPGVYPTREQCPWPAHPNILSYVEVVFNDEVTDEDNQGRTSRINWLKQQPPIVQEGVLGSRKKRAALEQGILKQNEIATPWKVLKKRYAGRGIDVDALRPAATEPGPVGGGSRANVPLTPAGAPVSEALNPRYYRTQVAHVSRAIDRVHGDGALPTIPIGTLPANAQMYGRYRWMPKVDRAVDISLLAGGDHRELTLAHEIGHFLDHKGLPGTGMTSEGGRLLGRWRDAALQSDAVRQLIELRNGPEVISTAAGAHQVLKGHLNYLLEWPEIWARSYAQYISLRSGDTLLQTQLRDLIDRHKGAPVHYADQWGADDFEPLAQEMDTIMHKMGWVNG